MSETTAVEIVNAGSESNPFPVEIAAPKAAPAKKPAPKPKAAPSPAPKKPAAKPIPKAKGEAKPSANGTAEYGAEKTKDVPWSAKKAAVFKALRKLGAVGAGAARGSSEVAAAGNGITAKDVRHYCYHAKVSGLTGLSDAAEGGGYGFYLTAKGAKVDPDAELKKAKSEKSKV